MSECGAKHQVVLTRFKLCCCHDLPLKVSPPATNKGSCHNGHEGGPLNDSCLCMTITILHENFNTGFFNFLWIIP